MKYFILISALFLMASLARASDTETFNTLMGKYKNSAAPNEEEVSGWRSGHCFLFDNPEIAFGAMMVGSKDPKTNAFHLADIGSKNYPPDEFDQLTPDKLTQIKGLIGSHTFAETAASYEDGALVAYLYREDIQVGGKVHVRKLGQQFILIETVETENAAVSVGTIVNICSFEKKVANLP